MSRKTLNEQLTSAIRKHLVCWWLKTESCTFGCDMIRSANLGRISKNIQASLVCHVLENPLALAELRVDEGEDMVDEVS